MQKCRVCNSKYIKNIVIAKESMLGYGGEFYYSQCINCGTVQLKNIPKKMERYYSYNYTKQSAVRKRYKFITGYILKLYFLNRNVHILINKMLGDANFFEILYIFLTLKPLQYTNNYNLLDYGCGNGNVLALLQPVANKIGVRNLVGIDPYLPNNNYNNKDIKLFKTDLLESKAVMKLNKRFDYIILNHSLEHLTRPLLILKQLRKIIKKDGGLYLLGHPLQIHMHSKSTKSTGLT